MAIYRNKSTKVDIQIGAMKALYPQFRVTKKTYNEVKFVGELQPKPEFRKFKVEILYCGNLRPKVKVISPKLVNEPPHFYKKSGTLCLYHPKDFKWSKDKLIAKYIVPITSAWLYFYEVWLETEIWYGPEAGHDNIKNDNDDKESTTR
jgi:hypothetical protein